MEQRIASTRRSDGTSVAYALAGAGRPLFFIDGWLSHLELSWALPAERRLLECLADGRTLVRYDRPGCGLSDRTAPETVSLESELNTVAAVLAAIGADRVDVLGSSLGAPVAVAWAARNPETVGRLILYGGWARGADIAPPQVRDHVTGLIMSHWGLGADVLTDIFAPDASAEFRTAIGGYQRRASSAATAAALLQLCYRIDVTGSLGDVGAATLVVHREHDRAAPVEQGRALAAGIPDAELRILPGRSHLPYTGDVDTFATIVRQFLGLPRRRVSPQPVLTDRQRQVAALVADGLTNRQIGQRLGIGERSAEGHVERIRMRLGMHSRAQVAGWWVTTSR